jgi:hypothetical protein
MNGSLKAIQIFLPSGDPHGIRIAELGGSNVQVTDVPRRFLGGYAAVPDSVQSGVYLLLDDANPPRQVYVAHGEPLLPQLTAHDAHRPGWHRALVVTSRLAPLTEPHRAYVAWLARRDLQLDSVHTHEAGSTDSAEPRIHYPVAKRSREVWSTARLLLTILGYPTFDAGAHAVHALRPLPALDPTPSTDDAAQHLPTTAVEASTPPRPVEAMPAKRRALASPVVEQLYRCTLLDSEGYGRPTPDGFLVLKGSRGPARNTSNLPKAHREFRQSLLGRGVLHQRDGQVVLLRDHLFSNATLAAVALTGSTCDGGMEWKTEDERTLFAMTRPYGGDGR